MKSTLIVVAIFVFTTVIFRNSAHAALQPVTVRLPDRAGLLAANGASGSPLFAGGDQYLFFVSEARNLVTNTPSSAGTHLYRRDRVSSETVLVSTGEPLALNPVTSCYSVSADGQRAAFAAYTKGGPADVFVRDIATGTTTLVSFNQLGTGGGNRSSSNPSLSADGLHVIFETMADDLVPGMEDGVSLCHRDLSTGETRLIGSWAVYRNVDYQVSQDGRTVVHSIYYAAPATELAAVPTTLVVWRRDTGQSTRVVLPIPSPILFGFTAGPEVFSLSDDGSQIAMFCRPGRSIYDEYLTGVWRYHTIDGTAEKIMPTTGRVIVPEVSVSADGQRIAFRTNSLPFGQGEKALVWSDGTGVQTLAELVHPPSVPPAELTRINHLDLSPDGTRLIFHTEEAVPEAGITEPGSLRAYLRVLATGETRVLTTDEDNIEPAYDADGELLAFQTSQRFDASDDNNGADVFLLSLDSGVRELVSTRDVRMASSMGTGNSSSTPSMSDDGRWLVFVSGADDLVPNDHNGRWDLFVHDRQNATNQLVSVNLQGTSAAQGVRWGTISPDGRSVLFLSSSPDVAAGDTNEIPDVFVRDLVTERTELISVDQTTGKSLGIPALSAVFTGDASKALIEARPLFVEGEFGTMVYPPRLFVRNRQAGTTIDVLAGMTNAWGFPLPHLLGSARIARDGSVVAFNGYEGTTFVRDLRDGSLETLPLPFESQVVDLSPDGRLVLVATPSLTGALQFSILNRSTRNLRSLPIEAPREIHFDASGTRLVYLAQLNQTWQIYVFPLSASGVPEVLRMGLNNALANRDCTEPRMSADGRLILFRSSASNLVEGDTNDTLDVFLHDRFSGKTRLISAAEDGQSPDGPSFGGALNAAGSAVGFTTAALSLTPGESGRFTQVLAGSITLDPPIDQDADGLPDRWEFDYFGGLSQGPTADPDGDQQTNAEELGAKTSPVDAISRVNLTSMADGQRGQLSWPGHVGVRYQLEQIDSISGNSGWSPLGEVISGYEGPMWFPIVDGTRSTFYRLIAVE